MKVLITGGAGFIGSNIADALVENGHDVIIVDNLSSGKKKNIPEKAKFYKIDITDGNLVDTIIKKEKPDVIDHHAAQIDVRKSVEDPAYDARVNVIGALNLLESARKHKVKKIIFASSGGTIYGEVGKVAPTELSPGNPLSPYGITKFTVEHYLNFYHIIHGLDFTVLRYANVYGPRQDPHGEAGVVAIFSGRMLANDDVTIFGDGKQTRDYVFVSDVVAANVAALTKGGNQIINIGTGCATSVNTLCETMASIAQYKHKPTYKPARAGELNRSLLDASKAKKILNWEPKVTLKEGLQFTIGYFRNEK